MSDYSLTDPLLLFLPCVMYHFFLLDSLFYFELEMAGHPETLSPISESQLRRL